MSVTYAPGGKTARMTAIRDRCRDGTLELLTSADALLVSIGLSADGGSVANDVWTITFDGAAAAGAAGAATKAQIKASGGQVEVFGLTVSDRDGTGDVKLQQVTTLIAQGQSVSVNSFTIRHSADPV